MADADIDLLGSLLGSGRFDEAHSLCLKLVEQGHPALAVHLGWMYLMGKSCRRDPDLACKYYRISAWSGDAMGQHYYGRFLMRRGEATRGIAWIERAASQQFPPSLYRLGYLYQRGTSVPIDLPRARSYLESAAALGHFYAKRDLILAGMNPRFGLISTVTALTNLIALLRDAWRVAKHDHTDARFIT